MEKLLVCIGVTGLQGGSVGDVFLNEPGWRVRGITRDPSKASSKALAEKGMEVVAADLNDPASILAAFKGAHAIFAMTDFWQFASDPETYKAAEEQKVPPNKICYDREVAQAKNIFEAAANPEVLATLERFVFSSLSDSKKWSNGKITQNLHFDGKADSVTYLKATYPDLWARTSLVQMGYYLDNWRASILFCPQKQPDGKTWLFRFASPRDLSEIEMPWVHPPKDTGHFVLALVTKASPNTTMLGFNAKISVTEWCNIWLRVMQEKGLIGSDAICKPAEPGSVTLKDVEEMAPGPFAEELYETFMYAAEFGFDGSDPDVKTPEECGVDLSKLQDLEEYLRGEDFSRLL